MEGYLGRANSIFWSNMLLICFVCNQGFLNWFVLSAHCSLPFWHLTCLVNAVGLNFFINKVYRKVSDFRIFSFVDNRPMCFILTSFSRLWSFIFTQNLFQTGKYFSTLHSLLKGSIYCILGSESLEYVLRNVFDLLERMPIWSGFFFCLFF